METIKTHSGMTIYKDMGFPESLEGLDREIVINTLGYYDFIAQMSDNYQTTLSEQKTIYEYAKKHNLL